MNRYEVVVFDWDGTLMDSTGDIVRAMRLACEDLDFPVPDEREAAWVIGLSLEKALEHIVPNLTLEQRPVFLDRYRFHYLARDKELQLFDGVREMLDALRQKGVALAVATGKSRVGLNRALQATGLQSYFEVTRCADETFGKPHPEMLLQIMDELVAQPQDVVMVGDTSHDLNMAANAGVHGLAVSYGAHHASELGQHPHQGLAHNVTDVNEWLSVRTRGRFGSEI